MSKDIRSYFSVISKKKKDDGNSTASSQCKSLSTPSNSKETSKSHMWRIDSDDEDDEDIVQATPPDVPKQKSQSKRAPKRQRHVLSDSDDEDASSKKNDKPSSSSHSKKKKTHFVPATLDDVIPNRPVKQSKVPDLPPPPPLKASPQRKSKGSKKGKKLALAELSIHDDPDFEQVLKDLDEEEILKQANDHKTNGIPEEKEEKPKDEDKKDEEKLKKEEEKTPTSKKRQRKSSSSEKTTPKKSKMDHTDSGIDPDQERYEKKRYAAMSYQRYLQRGGPKHQGQKEIPKGNPDCLKGLTFLRTGVMDSLESEEFNNLIVKHGGRVVHGVSKKVNYVVVGDEPGPAKLEKANNYKIPLIDEDELLDLILTKSGKPPKYSKKQPKSEDLGIEDDSSLLMEIDEPPFNENEEKKKEEITRNEKEEIKEKKKEEMNDEKEAKVDDTKAEEVAELITDINEDLPFTEKYKPTSTKNIIGQQGEGSNMNKLKNWLANWYKKQTSKKKKPLNFNPHSTEGANFKAALLSGPPGVGKTTTAYLVAKELGLDIVEFNASDTRNKKSLQEHVAQLLNTQTIAGYATGDAKTGDRKRVLFMDEVDGMSGNEDRGGIQELINLIKTTHVPIICMCNDRNNQKIRSLVYYCFDLRFTKPRMEQIRGAMMSICFREGIKIKPNVLAEIITGTGCDVRQTLNHLSLLAASKESLSLEKAKVEAKNAKKDTVLGPWEVCRLVFTENKEMSLSDRSRLFFYDYSIGPLFVQQNYLHVQPNEAKNKKETLRRATLAAQSISIGDLFSSKIREENNWALLDSQSYYSSVFPGNFMSGQFKKHIDFPSWLGKNSKRRKLKRLLGEIYAHTRTAIPASKEALILDYIVPLTEAIVLPLKNKGMEGINEAVEVMENYGLLREDLDSLIELYCLRKKSVKNPMTTIDPKVKSAFTRAYKKNAPLLPYAMKESVSKKSKINDNLTVMEDEEEQMEIEEDKEEQMEIEEKKDDDIEHDAFIKKKTSKLGGKNKETASTSKTKGKGRGRGKGKGKK